MKVIKKQIFLLIITKKIFLVINNTKHDGILKPKCLQPWVITPYSEAHPFILSEFSIELLQLFVKKTMRICSSFTWLSVVTACNYFVCNLLTCLSVGVLFMHATACNNENNVIHSPVSL